MKVKVHFVVEMLVKLDWLFWSLRFVMLVNCSTIILTSDCCFIQYLMLFALNPFYLFVCVCRQMTTPSWVSIRVSSWRTLMMHGCAPMTCSGWPFTTLANPLPTLVGRGGHSEGHRVRKYGGRGGRSWGWREHSTLPPAFSFTPVLRNKQTPDSRCQSLNLIQVGFQTTPASRTAMCFFAESRPTNQMPLSATPLICMTLGAPSLQYLHSSHQKDKQLTDAINSYSALYPSLLYSNSFYFNVDSTAVNSVLLALLLTGL